jgi:hypothetical protein
MPFGVGSPSCALCPSMPRLVFAFAQHAVALRDFLKRRYQFNEQDNVLWLRFLGELDLLLDL